MGRQRISGRWNFNRRMNVSDASGYCVPRVYQRKARGRMSARLRVKCGCCDQAVEIYYDDDDDALEIGGVHASKEEWKRILLPLLIER